MGSFIYGTNLAYLVFKPRGGGKWGPHGAPTPHSPRGGGLSLKKPRGGGFDQKKPRGFMGDLCPFYNFLDHFLLKVRKNEIKPRKFLPAHAVNSRKSV